MKKFVFQNNLIAENDRKQLQTACIKNNIAFEEVTVIPFVKELPEFTIDEENVYYGSTTFIECGCINSVGFYHADIEKIIIALYN